MPVFPALASLFGLVFNAFFGEGGWILASFFLHLINFDFVLVDKNTETNMANIQSSWLLGLPVTHIYWGN